MSDQALRTHLMRLLDWRDAHVSFDGAVNGIPAEQRGIQPANLPYSLWQLVDHVRFTQHDILEFCVNPKYDQPNWPDDYWPATVAPPSEQAWNDSLAGFRADREALKKLAAEHPDVFGKIPHGSGQTYFRELVLVADHNAYHVGQIVLVRRLLDIWPST
jgi:hypothetical protein